MISSPLYRIVLLAFFCGLSMGTYIRGSQEYSFNPIEHFDVERDLSDLSESDARILEGFETLDPTTRQTWCDDWRDDPGDPDNANNTAAASRHLILSEMSEEMQSLYAQTTLE